MSDHLFARPRIVGQRAERKWASGARKQIVNMYNKYIFDQCPDKNTQDKNLATNHRVKCIVKKEVILPIYHIKHNI